MTIVRNVTLRLSELDEVITNPLGYREKILNRTGAGGSFTLFSALRNAIFKFHGTYDADATVEYLMDQISRFKNINQRNACVNHFLWYINDYRANERQVASYRHRANIIIPDRLVQALVPAGSPRINITCEIGRIDIEKSGGCSVWMFKSRQDDSWPKDVQLPLIQYSISRELGIPLQQVNVGVYYFAEEIIRSWIYGNSDITNAHDLLGDLLEQMGFK